MRGETGKGRRGVWLGVALLAMCVFLAGVPVWAQGADQVIIYQNNNFGGYNMSSTGYQDVANLTQYHMAGASSPSWNDQISSIRVGVNEKVVCYADINFGGSSITFYGSSCAGTGQYSSMPSGWNDRISSFKIMANDAQQPDPAPSSSQAAVYEDANYCGAYQIYGISQTPNLSNYNTAGPGSPNWNDRISSIRVGSNVTLIVYKDAKYQGASSTLVGPSSLSNLASSGWNDCISSLKVVPK
jgi:hypothetical protein